MIKSEEPNADANDKIRGNQMTGGTGNYILNGDANDKIRGNQMKMLKIKSEETK